jgi:hypothetical protein
MPSQFDLYNQMVTILDTLLEVAKKLKEGLREKYSPQELESLQARQSEILRELATLNSLLEKSPPGASEQEIESCKKRIREKLTLFQTLNKEFFDHISSSSRVIDTQEKKKK